MGWRRIGAAVGGPLLIVAFVLVAMRGFVLHDLLTNQHPDVLSFWLPRWAFLGRALADGHVPLWNPYEMAGYRFAADPQSGWLDLSPMALFSTLGPGTAMRTIIVVHPLLAGLGLYAFLRVDGFGRVAATAGGLSLAATVANSEIAVSMPFAGTVAWTTVLLLGAAGFRRTGRWSTRLAWLALAAIGWSQVAASHLSHGLVVATALVVAYVAANVVGAWRRRETPAGPLVLRSVLFLVVLPLASLALLVPRLAFIDASSLGSGYDRLGDRVAGVVGPQDQPIQPGGVWAGWPFTAAAAPGAYAGAVVLLCVPAALRARRRRALVVAFGGVLALTYVLLLNAVLTAGWVRSALLAIPYGDVVLHNPGRLRYVAVLALPILGAAGLQGFLDDPPRWWAALLWLGTGAVLWLGVPLAAGGDLPRWAVFAAALLPAVAVIVVAIRRPAWAPVVLVVLTAEVLTVSVLAARWTGDSAKTGLEAGRTPPAIQPLRAPDVDVTAFLAPSPFAATIGSDRYLTWSPPDAFYEKGYLFAQDPWDWPALVNERGTLFGLQDVLGYNPVQLPRYWAFIRATNALPLYYNASAIQQPTRQDVRLLGIRWLIVPQNVPSPVPGEVVDRSGGYDLVRVDGAPSLVSAPTTVRVADGTADALRRSLRSDVDPSDTVVLEEPSGVTSGGPPGDVSYAMSAQRVVVDASLRSDAVVLVRISYDPGWHATVDGRRVEVLPADGFLLGVPMRAGDHRLVLTYRDDDVTRGLWLSAGVWGLLALGFLLALGLEWRAAGRTEAMSGGPS